MKRTRFPRTPHPADAAAPDHESERTSERVSGQDGAQAVRRAIRSFVRREGRITAAQRDALERLWPAYGVPSGPGRIDLGGLFGRAAPRALEIGFGHGEALLAIAAAHPECDYLGVEVYRPGVGSLLRGLEARGLKNVRVVLGDAVEVLDRHLPSAAFDAVHVWFPDPWPKKRHHKRRLVQPNFARAVAEVLRPGGVVRLATDWEEYARQMLEVFEAAPAFENLAGPGRFAARDEERPQTKFERRGQRLGHSVWDLAYRRTEGMPA